MRPSEPVRVPASRDVRDGGRWRVILAFLAVVLIGSIQGQAASAESPGEVASSTLEMSPTGGSLYKERRVPVEWRVVVEITAPWPTVPKVRPVKKITAAFPPEMTFAPAPGLPVCPDRILGPGSTSLGVPAVEMIRKCPKALIGNGRARLYLAKNNSPSGTNLNGSELVIFYGGLSASGTARIKVYGFDPQVGAGVYMEGNWENNVLEVDIPQLPFDTSTGFFQLSIPGSDNGFPDRVGRDPGFVRANCPDGLWEGTSEFLLGERDTSGLPFGQDSVIRAPDFRDDCVGLDGSPALRLVNTGGGKSVGRRTSISFLVSNPGTATARDITVRVSGRGVRAAPIPQITSLAPGASRRVSTGVTFSGKGKKRVRISASGRQVESVVVVRSMTVR